MVFWCPGKNHTWGKFGQDCDKHGPEQQVGYKGGKNVDEAWKSKTFCLEKIPDETIRLKRNLDYYIQVQGQLYCSNLDL